MSTPIAAGVLAAEPTPINATNMMNVFSLGAKAVAMLLDVDQFNTMMSQTEFMNHAANQLVPIANMMRAPIMSPILPNKGNIHPYESLIHRC